MADLKDTVNAALEEAGLCDEAYVEFRDSKDIVVDGHFTLEALQRVATVVAGTLAAHPESDTPPWDARRAGLRDLIVAWRKQGDSEIGQAFSGPYYDCANELEALLAKLPEGT